MNTAVDEMRRVAGLLACVNPDCARSFWVKMLMAVKSELGEAGRTIAEEWSAKGDKYDKAGFDSTWKSIKEGGNVTIATLVYEAKKNGHTCDSSNRPTPLTLEGISQREATLNGQYARARVLVQEQATRRQEAAVKAATIMNDATGAPADHPYLKSKGIHSHGARIYHGILTINGTPCDGMLMLPMYLNQKISSLQFIAEDGKKLFLPGGEKGGYPIGKLEPGKLCCICEGFATGATIHKATGYPVIVAFDAGNLCKMAEAFRAKNPDIKIILCADDDYLTSGNPGMTKAKEAARAVGGLLALPDFGEDRPEGHTDFNDMAGVAGLNAVKLAIDAAVPAPDPVRSDLSGLNSAGDTNIASVEQETIAGPSDADSVPDDKQERVKLICASDLKFEGISWLWQDWLAAGRLHILAGAPGTGKTSISMSLAATVTSGGKWPDGKQAISGKVVIWSGEDDPADTLTPRLIKSGANLDNVHFITGIKKGEKERSFDPAKDMELLRDALAKIGNVRLLIVDPIVSAIAGDSHKNTEVRRGLQPLVDLAARLGCALLGITHFTKGTGGRDPVERITGSLAFAALARVVMVAAKEQEEGEDGRTVRIFCRAKSNIGPDNGGFEYDLQQGELETHPGIFASYVKWGMSLEGTARELLAVADATSDDGDGGTLADAKKFLADLLADGPRSQKSIREDAEGAGYSMATIRRAQKELKIDAIKESMKGGWVWQMPGRETAKAISENTKMLKNTEDAQQKMMSTFAEIEHLRSNPAEMEL